MWLWASTTHVCLATLMPKLWRSSSPFQLAPWLTWSCAVAIHCPLTPMTPTQAWLPLWPFWTTKIRSLSTARRSPTTITRHPATAVRTTTPPPMEGPPSTVSQDPTAPLLTSLLTPLPSSATPAMWSPWPHPSPRNQSSSPYTWRKVTKALASPSPTVPEAEGREWSRLWTTLAVVASRRATSS